MARDRAITAADVLGAATLPVTPSAPNPTVAQLGSGGGGGGFMSGLKKLGGTALNALTVPQAAAFTVNTNLIRAFAGKPGISWKNLGGGFYDKYGGARTTLFPTIGIDPNSRLGKWGGLATDIVADPLWAVSLVPGAGQAYAAAKFGKAARAAGRLDAIPGGRAAMADLDKYGKFRAVGPFAGKYNQFMDVFKGPAKFHELATGARGFDLMRGAGAKTGDDLADLESALAALRGKTGAARVNTKNLGYIPTITIGSKRLGGVVIPLTNKPIRVGKALRSSRLRVAPLAAEAAALKNAAESRTQMRAEEINRLFTKVLKDADAPVTDDVVVGIAMLKRAKSAQDGAKAIKALRERGLWAERHQQLLDEAIDGLRHQARLTGQMTAGDLAATMRTWMAGAGLRGVDEQKRVAKATTTLREREAARAAAALSPKQTRDLATLQTKLDRMAINGLEDSPEYKRVAARVAKLEGIQRRAFERVVSRNKRIGELGKRASVKADEEAYGELLTVLREADPAIANALTRGGRIDPGRIHPDLVKPLGDVANVRNSTTRRMEEMAKVITILDELDYVPVPARPMSATTIEGIKASMEKGAKTAASLPDNMTSDMLHSTDVGRFGDVFNQVDVITRRNVVDELVRSKVPRAEAERVAAQLDEALDFSKEEFGVWRTAEIHNLDPVIVSPEMRGRELWMAGDRAAYDAMAEREMVEMVRAVGLGGREAFDHMGDDIAKVLDDLVEAGEGVTNDDRINAVVKYMMTQYNVSYDNAVGWLNIKLLGTRGPTLNTAIGWLKVWFTNMNPAHFFTNAWGSMVNGAIKGGVRQLSGARASVPGSDFFRLADVSKELSPEFLAKTVRIGPTEYTYADLLVTSRFMGLGLGHGQSAQEIELMINLLDSPVGKNPLKAWAKFGQKMNMTREDADRLLGWVNFMKAGDNPVTAAANVVFSRFDYGALTHFEKVWMRNLMLFYTWFRKNLEYQVWGIMSRPGAYNAFDDMNRNRDRDPNEPEYLSRAFGVWTPLFGDNFVTFSNPMSDIHKLDFTVEGGRRNVLSGLNPLFLTPVEAAMNKRFFTGAEIDKYPLADQKVPNQILGRLPFIGGTTRGSASGSPEPGVSPMLDLVWDSLKGPLGNQVEKTVTNSTTATEDARYAPLLKTLTGLTIEHPEPLKWQRNKYYEILNRMADTSAMYRLER